MRRTPAATPLSRSMVNKPMSPVARQWVPPHSSRLKLGMDTTRTVSPYFSPNNAIAPAAIASLVGLTSVITSVLRRTSSLTSRSIASSSLGGDSRRVDEVESQPIGRDERAGLLHVRPEHLAQRGVQQVRGGVIAADRIAARGVDRQRDQRAGRQRAARHLHVMRARRTRSDPHDAVDARRRRSRAAFRRRPSSVHHHRHRLS